MLSRASRNENPEPQEKNKWVKKLQQESWELELLVSGFSIILLAKLTEWLKIVIENVQFGLNLNINLSIALMFFLMFILLASYALIINLIIHLIFRGFWVGIVGLGSVAPNTEFPKLKYSSFFTKKLEKKVTKLDDLVIIVDKISSLIFAFAFLIIFFLISVGLFLISLIIIQSIGDTIVDLTNGSISNIFKYIFVFITITFLLSGIIYMIDFFTLGFFKKYKWLSKIYFPIYYLFSWITLSFLYRTLYYNLISKFSKRKIGVILIPYLLIIIMVPFFSFNHHIYYPEESEKSHINHNYYSDLRNEEDHIEKVDLPSYIIKNNFLPVFISYNPNDNHIIKKTFPDFTPGINEGLNSKVDVKINKKGINININDAKRNKHVEESLECLCGLYRIYLNDSLVQNPKFYFKTNINKEEKGIFTVINISDLPVGENILTIKKISFKKDQQILKDYAFAPFWKE